MSTMISYPIVSIICPTYNEEQYISKCVASILQQDYPQDNLDILFVDGQSSDATRDIILSAAETHTIIQLIDNPYQHVPYALNIGIEHAVGEIIIRIDAHASFPTNYVSTLVHHLRTLPGAQNVGAPCITKTLGTSNQAKAIVAVLSNKWGVGNSTFRLGVEEIQTVDTVPFGCWKKETLNQVGMFNTRLTRNQDIELNKRILKSGGKIYLVPDTYCIYYARETFKSLAKNNFSNGKWNILTIYYTKEIASLSIRHFVPLLFILSLLLPMLGMIVSPYFGILSALSLFCYCILIGVVSWQIKKQQDITFLSLIVAFITLHLSYGLGSLIGILSLPFLKK